MDQNKAKELFDYDYKTGKLYWKVSPRTQHGHTYVQQELFA